MNDQQRAAMIRPRGKSVFPQMVAAYKAMQMALEAFDSPVLKDPFEQSMKLRRACDALREALAQPQERFATPGKVIEPQDHSGEATDMVEWVDLTDDEFETAIRKLRIDETMTLRDWNVGRAVIAKLKEKNTPPVVSQGEPVFLSYDDPLISETIKNDPLYIRGYEAAIEATKEKAAKVCEKYSYAIDSSEEDDFGRGFNAAIGQCAAAIRSME